MSIQAMTDCLFSILFAFSTFCGIIPAMEEPFAARPVVGRWVALEVQPTRPLTFVGPSWAVLCGALASGALFSQFKSLLFLALAIFLCDSLLGTWRALWLQPDWRYFLTRNYEDQNEWQGSGIVSSSSSRSRLVRLAVHRLDYFATTIWPIIDSEIIGLVIAGLASICLALILGNWPLVLTLVAMLFAVIEGLIGTTRGAGLRSIVDIALPWLIAESALGELSWAAVVLALLFTLVYRSLLALATTREERWVHWGNLSQIAVVIVLVSGGRAGAAGLVLLGLLAQILWQARFLADLDGQSYARRVQSYVLVTMLVAALSIWI